MISLELSFLIHMNLISFFYMKWSNMSSIICLIFSCTPCIYSFFIETPVSIGEWIYIYVLDLIPFIYVSVFIPEPCFFSTQALYYNLKLVITWAFLLYFRIILILHFFVNMKIAVGFFESLIIHFQPHWSKLITLMVNSISVLLASSYILN